MRNASLLFFVLALPGCTHLRDRERLRDAMFERVLERVTLLGDQCGLVPLGESSGDEHELLELELEQQGRELESAEHELERAEGGN